MRKQRRTALEIGQPVTLNPGVRWQPTHVGRRLANMRGTVVAQETTHRGEFYTVYFPAAEIRLGLLSSTELTAL